MTLNETLSLEAAEHLAKRMTDAAKGDDKAAIAHGFHLCTSRQPTEKETRVLLGAAESATHPPPPHQKRSRR
jgi:hypothetical protein